MTPTPQTWCSWHIRKCVCTHTNKAILDQVAFQNSYAIPNDALPFNFKFVHTKIISIMGTYYNKHACVRQLDLNLHTKTSIYMHNYFINLLQKCFTGLHVLKYGHRWLFGFVFYVLKPIRALCVDIVRWPARLKDLLPICQILLLGFHLGFFEKL